jgi:hypothetical protein
MDDVRVYHRPPERYHSLWKARLARFGVIVSVMAACLAIVIWRSGASQSLTTWIPPLVMFLGFLLWVVRTARRVAARLMTYQLTLGPNVMRIVCDGFVPTEVLRSDVTRIVESSEGLRVEAGRVLTGVPRDLAGYADARARLAEWHAIERARFGNAWSVAILCQGALWLFGLVLPLGTAALAGLFVPIAGVSVALVRYASRTSLQRQGRAQLYTAQLLILASMALRVYLHWGSR